VHLVELKKPALKVVRETAAANLHVLHLAPADQPARELRPQRVKIWNSFFVRLMVSMMAVALPFLIIAGLLPNFLGAWGVGPEVVAVALLVGITGIAARLMIHPVTELSRVAALGGTERQRRDAAPQPHFQRNARAADRHALPPSGRGS
jgi:uncharacterized membrane protein (DUF485 family)